MKPIIGILSEIDMEKNSKLQNIYIKAVETSGGVPILLPYVEDSETMERFVGLCDGFLFTGGADVNPNRYGEEKKSTCEDVQYYRDELEFRVFQKALSTSKPILAICRGAQLTNVALGGTLYQDIPTELDTQIPHRQSEPDCSPSHEVKVFADTPLYKIAGTERIQANSFHHQAIKKLGKGLAVMAVADDEMIEAFYLSGERYLCAYQWHPERLYETNPHNRRIFDDFINACKAERP